MAKSMYDIIKKQNGERFAQAIRNNGILEVPDIDKIVKYAGSDAEPILGYLESLKNIQIEEHGTYQDPIALLDKAGYNAYVADTLEKQNATKKYYARGEELCTFGDPNRFKYYYIINAVRKDVDEIKREDFTKPERDDRYGTSVISIQILKTGGQIGIKNRYNHTVNNCDNTFDSNPDNIIKGLSYALKHHFNVDFSSQHVPLYGKYTLIGKQIYHYQGEQNNVYWSENSYLIDGHIVEINKDSQIMLGNGLLLDLQQKEVRDVTYALPEDFVESLNHAIENKKLLTTINPQGGRDIFADKKRILTVENAEIVNINIPDAHTIILHGNNLRGDLDFTDVKNLDLGDLHFSRATSIKFPKEPERLRLRYAKFPACDLDFSGTKELYLDDVDLSHATSIKFPKEIITLHLSGAKLPACDLDFGGAEDLYLNTADLSHATSIKFPQQARFINLNGAILPACDLDFGDVKNLYLNNADLSRATSIKFSKKTKDLYLSSAKLPACNLDFGGAENICLRNVDLSHATSIKFPKEIEYLDLSSAKLPACDLDFGDVKNLYLNYANLSHATSIKFPKEMITLHLSGAKLPACDLDFSGTKELSLYDADLSRATSIKFPKKMITLDLIGAKLPACDLDFSGIKELYLDGADLSRATSIKFPSKSAFAYGIEKILQSVQQKLKNMRLIQNAKNQNDSE